MVDVRDTCEVWIIVPRIWSTRREETVRTLSVLLCLATLACGGTAAAPIPLVSGVTGGFPIPWPAGPREPHLANLRQLTDGIQNAEASFSFDRKRLIFQSTRTPSECDQIFAQFDGFPMRAPDGRTFVFCSNRFNSGPHQANVFLADWVDKETGLGPARAGVIAKKERP